MLVFPELAELLSIASLFANSLQAATASLVNDGNVYIFSSDFSRSSITHP